jgi:hypothetical protein
MENLPIYIALVFGAATFLTVYLFYKAAGQSRKVLMFLLAWLIVQTVISVTGFYTVTDTIPPRFALTIGPPVLFMLALFMNPKGRKFIDSLNIKTLTLLHVIRIPIEVILLWLFVNKAIPQVMTFEGRNFDIISGITAPVIYYFAFIKRKIGAMGLVVWNVMCLGLLINIVVIAILAAPFAFQRLAFDQPNMAVLYFPFTWLPACVVPLVLFSHVAAIRRILIGKINIPVPETQSPAAKTFYSLPK